MTKPPRTRLEEAFKALRMDLLSDEGPQISTLRNYRYAIIPYEPEDEFELRRHVQETVGKLSTGGWHVLSLSLQKLLLQRLRKNGDDVPCSAASRGPSSGRSRPRSRERSRSRSCRADAADAADAAYAADAAVYAYDAAYAADAAYDAAYDAADAADAAAAVAVASAAAYDAYDAADAAVYAYDAASAAVACAAVYDAYDAASATAYAAAAAAAALRLRARRPVILASIAAFERAIEVRP